MTPLTERAFEYVVRQDDVCERVDKFLAGLVGDLSRTTFQKMISENLVLVNGDPVKSSYKVKPGDLLEYEELPLTQLDIMPENIPLDVVYEDDDLLVVNKPSGMVVHPAPGHATGTLVNALIYHFSRLSHASGELRPGIVHRIDKDTSGLLMVAKTDFAHQRLQQELKDKTTLRVYLALVDGVILNEKGSIDAPIGRDKTDRKKMAVVESGKPAITHFTVEERFAEKTLIKCRLETGRTHQIRVHMAFIDHPLLGDNVYGRRKQQDAFGQYLHAISLGFTHPRTNVWLEFASPIPGEFASMLDQLRQNNR